jgi:serine/threonine protein kinase
MAPEQFGGNQPPDPRTDVWALGVTMYELLTLRRPFDGPHDELVNQIKTAEPRSPRQITPAVPNDLDAICRKAMRKSPTDRYDTAGAFAADLRHWMNNEPTKANPPWAGRRMAMWAKREPGWAMMASVAGIAACAIVLTALSNERHNTAIAQMGGPLIFSASVHVARLQSLVIPRVASVSQNGLDTDRYRDEKKTTEAVCSVSVGESASGSRGQVDDRGQRHRGTKACRPRRRWSRCRDLGLPPMGSAHCSSAGTGRGSRFGSLDAGNRQVFQR